MSSFNFKTLVLTAAATFAISAASLSASVDAFAHGSHMRSTAGNFQNSKSDAAPQTFTSPYGPLYYPTTIVPTFTSIAGAPMTPAPTLMGNPEAHD